LTSIDLPDGLWSIGVKAFYGCERLASIKIPHTVTTIDHHAFWDCKSLTSITIPSGVTNIEWSVFNGCISLASVSIPNGVTSIGQSAFMDCTALEDIFIPNTVKSIGKQSFQGCSKLTSVVIPNSVGVIGDAAFKDCTSLTNVTIPDGVLSIGERAFHGCSSLTSVSFSNSVTSIGIDAFYLCSALTGVYCYAAKPPTLVVDGYGDPPFVFNASGRKFYVPEASLADYQKSWSAYSADIVGIPVYTISLEVSPDSTFGTATVSTTIAAQGDKVKLIATPKPGYQFIWWESTGGSVITKPSAEYTTLTMSNRNVTLNALFRGTDDNPETHTLTLDNNDDNPMGMAEIHEGIKSYTLPTRTRNGYYFLDWATSATGDPAYKAGETVNLERDLTLYAIWLKTPVELLDNEVNATTISKLKELGAIDVKLSRRSLVKDGYWNTLCLPFSLTAAQLEDSPLAGATLMELDTEGTYDNRQTGFDATTGTLYLYFKTATAIEEGKPYIIKWGTPLPDPDPDATVDAIYEPTFTGVTVNSTDSLFVTSADGAVSFTGIYNPISLVKDDKTVLYMGEANTLYYPNAAMDINSFRTFFLLNNGLVCGEPSEGGSGINNFVLNFGDFTGLTPIPSPRGEGSSYYYSLDGRRLSGKPTAKGVYINNGHKVVIK
jgi:hypothetical protein